MNSILIRIWGFEKPSPNLPDLAGHVAAVAFSSQDSGQFRLLAMAPRNAMGLSHMLKLWDLRADLVSSRLLRHRTSKLSLSTLLEKENGEPGRNMEQQQWNKQVLSPVALPGFKQFGKHWEVDWSDNLQTVIKSLYARVYKCLGWRE